MRRFSITYDTPDGERRLSSRTRNCPFVPDEVDTGDVDAHAVGRLDARGLPVEVLARGDEALRDDHFAQDRLLAVDVVEEHLERLDPLLDAALEPVPLRGGDHAGHEVEGERPLLTRQRERDALVDECAPEGVRPRGEVLDDDRGEGIVDAPIGSADGAVVKHLVERALVRPDAVAVENAGLGTVAPGAARTLAGGPRRRLRTHSGHGAIQFPRVLARAANFSRFGNGTRVLVASTVGVRTACP